MLVARNRRGGCRVSKINCVVGILNGFSEFDGFLKNFILDLLANILIVERINFFHLHIRLLILCQVKSSVDTASCDIFLIFFLLLDDTTDLRIDESFCLCLFWVKEFRLENFVFSLDLDTHFRWCRLAS